MRACKHLRNPFALGFGLCVALLVGCREDAHSSHSEHTETAPRPLLSGTPPINPVQHEMQLLTGALERAVRAIGLGDVRAIAHDLHRVHAAKEATEAAIREGKYRPPRNPERLDRFRELDVAFHGHLEQLVKASNANDVPATAVAFASTIQGCQGCHAEFRN